MILQAESKREYEEVSVEIKYSSFIYIFISNTGVCLIPIEKLSTLTCVLFIFAFGLRHICHSLYHSLRQHVSTGNPNVDLCGVFFFSPQWICTVNNISRQIYLTDNPEVTHTLPEKFR